MSIHYALDWTGSLTMVTRTAPNIVSVEFKLKEY